MTRRRFSVLLILAMVLVTAVGVYLIRAVQEPRNSKVKPVPVPVERLAFDLWDSTVSMAPRRLRSPSAMRSPPPLPPL